MAKTRSRPLWQDIFAALKDDICQHRLHPGEKLLESDLAARFRVSRTPIREALHQLVREGFVTYAPNVGATVKKNSPEDFRELFEISSLLEGHAVTAVVRAGISRDAIDYLRGLHSEMKARAKALDFAGWEAANRKFHDFFLSNCGNATLEAITSNLRSKMYMADQDKLPLAIHIGEYMREHAEIIAAALAGDADRAGELMKRHIWSIHENRVKRSRQAAAAGRAAQARPRPRRVAPAR